MKNSSQSSLNHGGFLSRNSLALAGLSLALLFSAAAQDPAEAIRKAAREVIEAADTETTFKKQELAKKYAAALETLEKKLAAAGDLDGVIHAREERAEVLKSGKTTAHQDKGLVELREKYTTSLDGIESGMTAAREKVVEQVRASVRQQEAALTKAGKVDEAIALRKEGEKMLLEFGGGAAAEEVGFEEDPRFEEKASLKDLPPIEVPQEKPELQDKPFANKERWLTSLTVPVAKQKIRDGITIGDRAKKAWPLVVVSPGSHWAGAGNTAVEVSAGKFVSAGSRFEGLRFFADLECYFFFTRGVFDECRFDKGGVWYGSEQAGKFYFEECLVRESFAGEFINVVDNGLRAERSVFEDIEFPTMLFRKKQPANYLNHKWLRLVNCRFVGCTLPASFLFLTRDCVFENCTFVDDPKPAKPDEEVVEKPFEIVLYVKDSKNKITRLQKKATLVEKPIDQLKGVTIPTAEELLKLNGP
jgi:hypothetical protein